MKLLIISGLSGSGKSIVLHALEDMGYYCVDNLPLSLIPGFAKHIVSWPGKAVSKVAVGIDSRNLADLQRYPEIINEVERNGLDIETVFLNTSPEILLKRFSETRRRHPLSGSNVVLAEAIAHERTLLEPVFSNADLRIDTSQTNVHQLRRLINDRFSGEEQQSVSILLESFGFKNGIPVDADFVFDVRCLPNPHWEANLRPLTGLDQAVQEFLNKYDEVNEMFTDIKSFLEKWLPRFASENRSYMSIAIGCTGGQHRSVYLIHRLNEYFRQNGYPNIIERHREQQ